MKPLLASPNERILPIVEALGAERREARSRRSFMLGHWAGLLLGECLRLQGEVSTEGDQARQIRSSQDKRLAAFDALVEAHFRDRWSVADFAAKLSISTTHLNRIIREGRDISAAAEIEARVMQEAKRLLAYTMLPVARVGEQVGFADPAHFSRRFKAATGSSPSDYRALFDR